MRSDEIAMDMSALLPDGVLADVLGRLAERHLAVSRSVCKAWRTVIDEYGLLRTEHLPLSLAGFLINFSGTDITKFFTRPSPLNSKTPCNKHDFLADGEIGSWSRVLDHCNGLLLTERYEGGDADRVLHVLNPATRRRAPVPPSPYRRRAAGAGRVTLFETEYLAYDPAVSPHYQILSVPSFGYRTSAGEEVETQLETPPATCVQRVFSSATGEWEERPFVRVGKAAAGTAWPNDRHNAAYRRGELYIRCHANFVMRISLTKDEFSVIKPPAEATNPQFYVGKSERGIYCTSFHGSCRLQVWVLDDSKSSSLMKWELKHDQDLLQLLWKNKFEAPSEDYRRQVRGPWMMQHANYNYNRDANMKVHVKEEFEWSSDASDDETSECCLDSANGNTRYFNPGYFRVLGFHPFKEIIFFSQSTSRVLSYHLKRSTVQEIGNLCHPKGYGREQVVESSFPYTSCWIELGSTGLSGH